MTHVGETDESSRPMCTPAEKNLKFSRSPAVLQSACLWTNRDVSLGISMLYLFPTFHSTPRATSSL